jgi:hypothetical protein
VRVKLRGRDGAVLGEVNADASRFRVQEANERLWVEGHVLIPIREAGTGPYMYQLGSHGVGYVEADPVAVGSEFRLDVRIDLEGGV